MRYRSDSDSLGTVKIPADAYYGPFTGRAMKQYHVTGQKPHTYLIKSFVMIKRSAAIANMRTKALDRKRGNAIVKACDKILAEKYQDQFVVDMINSGAGTAFNMNTNEVVANVALKILHKGLGQYQHTYILMTMLTCHSQAMILFQQLCMLQFFLRYVIRCLLLTN